MDDYSDLLFSHTLERMRNVCRSLVYATGCFILAYTCGKLHSADESWGICADIKIRVARSLLFTLMARVI